MSRKTITIYTEAGGDIGYGHVVRMRHLYIALTLRGHHVEILANEPAASWLNDRDIPTSLSRAGDKHLLRGGDIAIVDVMNTDNKMLAALKRGNARVAVIVGAGHTVDMNTRWIADQVFYQTAYDRSLHGVTPGEKVYTGLEWLILDSKFADALPYKTMDIVGYIGGGVNNKFLERVYEELEAREYVVSVLGGKELWDEDPMVYLEEALLYVGSMGMMAYEAILCETYPMVVCRSEDHIEAADRLEDLGVCTSFGMITRPTKENSVQTVCDRIEKKLKSWKKHPFKLASQGLDGKGLFRVAEEIINGA